MPQDIPETCNGFSKKYLIEHDLSCTKGGLVWERNDYAAKEWGALGAQDLIPSAISYKNQINTRKVQRERTSDGVQM